MIHCKTGNLWFFLKNNLQVQRRVWRYQRGNQNRHHNGQKKKIQKDKQRSTKHTLKT